MQAWSVTAQQADYHAVQVYAWSKLEAEAAGKAPPRLETAFTYELCAGKLVT